jgi:tRNA threonylcarbamoyladenosine biosynthesis protein TsaE
MVGPHVLDFISHSVDQTRRVGARLGRLLIPGDVILLDGEFGAGKTCLTQGIARGLGVTRWVTSPSFALVNEYPEGRLPLYHIDLYRLESVEEILDLGLDEYLYGAGVSAVEWPGQALNVLPSEHLWIELSVVSETKREVYLTASGRRYHDLLRQFRTQTFTPWSRST